MILGRGIICQFWEDHRRALPVVAAVMWGLLVPLLYLTVAAEPLKVAGLPVT
jgi:hypothetical protein